MPTTAPDRTARRLSGATTLACGLLLALAGCSPPGKELQAGSYRATLELGGAELPFGLDVAKEEAGVAVYLLDGEEHLRLDGIHVAPARLTAMLPGGGRLTAAISGADLAGEVQLASAGGQRPLPFKARQGQTWRFFEAALTDNADVSGRWALTLLDDQGVRTRGVAEFRQSFERVSVTMDLAGSNANERLSGEVHGEEVRLGRFDGRSASLYRLQVDARGHLQGEAWSTHLGHYRVEATRDDGLASNDESVPAT